jgi:hypothetical protein
MQIEHIIWNDYDWDETVSGILEIEIVWHGGGSDTFISQGVYTNKGCGEFTNIIIGIKVNEDTMGVSGVNCLRVGEIVG